MGRWPSAVYLATEDRSRAHERARRRDRRFELAQLLPRIPVDFSEEVGNVELERRHPFARRPHEFAREDLGFRVSLPPTFDEALPGVDDPVLADVLLHVDRALPVSVGARGARRQHFDDEEKRLRASPARWRTVRAGWDNEDVGLDEASRREHDVSRSDDRPPEPTRAHIRMQLRVEFADRALMPPRRRLRHEQLAVEHLVAIAIVRQRVGAFDGPVQISPEGTLRSRKPCGHRLAIHGTSE